MWRQDLSLPLLKQMLGGPPGNNLYTTGWERCSKIWISPLLPCFQLRLQGPERQVEVNREEDNPNLPHHQLQAHHPLSNQQPWQRHLDQCSSTFPHCPQEGAAPDQQSQCRSLCAWIHLTLAQLLPQTRYWDGFNVPRLSSTVAVFPRPASTCPSITTPSTWVLVFINDLMNHSDAYIALRISLELEELCLGKDGFYQLPDIGPLQCRYRNTLHLTFAVEHHEWQIRLWSMAKIVQYLTPLIL